jgi:hypothetical protein
MKANLAAREPELLRMWQETRLYQQIQKARQDAELFVLHDGPPFANGDVHTGTALNKILKDLVVKSQSIFGGFVNTLRILLGNLYDFRTPSPSSSPLPGERVGRGGHLSVQP